MSNSLKAALLSGLVFPGIGQFSLKYYKRGFALIIAVSVCLSVIVVQAVQYAFDILDQIQSDGGAIDMDTILSIAHQASTSFDSRMTNFSTLFLIICWVIGILDAYMLGKKMDVEGESPSSL